MLLILFRNKKRSISLWSDFRHFNLEKMKIQSGFLLWWLTFELISGITGAGHSDELLSLFSTNASDKLTTADRKLSEQIITYWVNFMYSGWAIHLFAYISPQWKKQIKYLMNSYLKKKIFLYVARYLYLCTYLYIYIITSSYYY